MHSSNPRSTSKQIGRGILLKDAEMLSWKSQSHKPVGYETPSPHADNKPHRFEANLSSQRNSSSSLHSSSSSRHFRPSTPSRKKSESSLNNWQETQENHLPQINSCQMSSPRDHLQKRQSVCLPSPANSHSEDSADELSPRQLPGKSSLSKYKPLPAIRAKNHGTSSAYILQTTSDYQVEDIVTNKQKNSSSHTITRQIMGLTREPSMLQDNDHAKETIKNFVSSPLELKKSSTQPRQPYENTEELLSQRISPQNSTSGHPVMPPPIDLSAEPSPEEARTLLAVKLPSGKRVQRFFRFTDPLRLVRQFAELSSRHDFTNFQLVKSVPREILNLEETIEENHLLEKTLLHLEKSPPP